MPLHRLMRKADRGHDHVRDSGIVCPGQATCVRGSVRVELAGIAKCAGGGRCDGRARMASQRPARSACGTYRLHCGLTCGFDVSKMG